MARPLRGTRRGKPIAPSAARACFTVNNSKTWRKYSVWLNIQKPYSIRKVANECPSTDANSVLHSHGHTPPPARRPLPPPSTAASPALARCVTRARMAVRLGFELTSRMDWQRWLGLEAGSDDEEDLTRRRLLGPRKRALLSRRQSQSHHWCLLPSIAVLAAVLAWSVLDAFFTRRLELTRVYVPAPLPRPPPAPPSQEGRWVQRAAPPPVRGVSSAENNDKPALSPPCVLTAAYNPPTTSPPAPPHHHHRHAHAGGRSGGRTAGDCCRTKCSSGCVHRRRSGCGRRPW